ncbi:MAG: hypothetical protein EBS53_00570 [Bacteroidetes bacterium]|nr:hypothetical protein [Bacteroidota bacterium]
MKKSKSKQKRSICKEEKLFAARVNLGGLYASKPIAVFYQEDNWYASKDGNFVVDLNAPNNRPSCIDFVSAVKTEVENWIAGASAAMRCVHEWSRMVDDR